MPPSEKEKKKKKKSLHIFLPFLVEDYERQGGVDCVSEEVSGGNPFKLALSGKKKKNVVKSNKVFLRSV